MHATSVYIAREQFIRHQTVERMQARSEDFHSRVVRALLHTRVFMKFKSSYTVYIDPNEYPRVLMTRVFAIAHHDVKPRLESIGHTH